MAEFGIFDDSGCVETGFVSLSAAETAIQMEPAFYGDHAHAHELCPDHPEQARAGCEECDPD